MSIFIFAKQLKSLCPRHAHGNFLVWANGDKNEINYKFSHFKKCILFILFYRDDLMFQFPALR